MSSPIRYFVGDAITGQIIDEVTFESFSWTRARNKPGSWSATINWRRRQADPKILRRGASAVWVSVNDKLRFGGILWTLRHGLQLGGEGFLSYYREGRRTIRSRAGMSHAGGANPAEITFAGVEQFDIVADLLAHAAAYAGGANIGFDDLRFYAPTLGARSGVARTETYMAYERNAIGDVIEKLAALDRGFDFSEGVEWGGDGRSADRFLSLWYPRKGADTGVVLEVGAGVTLKDYSGDAGQGATRGIGIGSGAADSRLTVEVVADELEYPTGVYPLIEYEQTYSLDNLDSVDAAIARDFELRHSPGVDTFVLSITGADAVEKLGAIDIGDLAQVVIDDGYYYIDGKHRVTAISAAVNPAGAVSLDVTCMGPSLTPARHRPAAVAPLSPVIQVTELGFCEGFGLFADDDTALAQRLDGMVAIGATWLRNDVPWSFIEATEGAPDWDPTDRIIDAATERGLQFIGVLDYTPDWAHTGHAGEDHYPPDDPADYAAFCTAAVERYSDRVHVWEIWNEPNGGGFWQPAADPDAYTELLQAAYTAIKAADPTATVLTGGTAPAADGGSDVSPNEFLKGIYDAGGKDYFDAVAHHPYCYPLLPGDAVAEFNWNAFGGVTPVLRQTMIDNGDLLKKIWGTEHGAPVPHDSMDADYLEADIAEAVALWSSWSYTGPLIWFSYRDAGLGPGTEDLFGLVDRDFTPKGDALDRYAEVAG